MTTEAIQHQRNGRRAPWVVILGVVAAAATFFLWDEHEPHILRVLPYALLLLLAVLHLLTHRSHGGAHDHRSGHDHA